MTVKLLRSCELKKLLLFVCLSAGISQIPREVIEPASTIAGGM